MSIFQRTFHGPEVKCGGPQMCPDCRERVRLAEESGFPLDINNPLLKDWFKESKPIIKNTEKDSKLKK